MPETESVFHFVQLSAAINFGTRMGKAEAQIRVVSNQGPQDPRVRVLGKC